MLMFLAVHYVNPIVFSTSICTSVRLHLQLKVIKTVGSINTDIYINFTNRELVHIVIKKMPQGSPVSVLLYNAGNLP